MQSPVELHSRPKEASEKKETILYIKYLFLIQEILDLDMPDLPESGKHRMNDVDIQLYATFFELKWWISLRILYFIFHSIRIST